MSQGQPKRTLSKRESFLLSGLAASGRTLFTIEDARARLDTTKANTRKLLYRLHRKQWIRRLERGKYLILPLAAGPEVQWAEHEYLIAASLVDSYYLAYATALRYYGYSDRLPAQVIIATTQRKRPVTISGINYRFVTLQPYKFFGFVPVSLLGRTVQMAEREKAVADGFDRPELTEGVLEAAKGLWFGSRELDFEKVVTYTLRLRNQVAARRLGFWMELLNLGNERLLSTLEGGRGHSYAFLEPSGADTGSRNARWRLIINVPERQLLEWKEH